MEKLAPFAHLLAVFGFVLLGFGAQLGGAFGLGPVFGIGWIQPEGGQQPGSLLDPVFFIDPDAPSVGFFKFDVACDPLDVEVVGKGPGGLLLRQMAD